MKYKVIIPDVSDIFTKKELVVSYYMYPYDLEGEIQNNEYTITNHKTFNFEVENGIIYNSNGNEYPCFEVYLRISNENVTEMIYLTPEVI